MKLLIVGLGWRGGHIVGVQGTLAKATTLFNEWVSRGETKVLSPNEPRIPLYYISSDDE